MSKRELATGDYRFHARDTVRAWMRDRTRRDLVDKTTTAVEAVGRLVAGSDSVPVIGRAAKR